MSANIAASMPSLNEIASLAGLMDKDKEDRRSSGRSASEDLAREAEALLRGSSMDLVKLGLMFIGALAVLKALASLFFAIGMVAFPVLYFYLVQTCPEENSFNAKQELKRVLRGHHLGDDDPNKPTGYLESMMARATASVTAEKTALTSGCKPELSSYGGAIILAQLKVPSEKIEIYWIGAMGQWRYVFTGKLVADNKKNR